MSNHHRRSSVALSHLVWITGLLVLPTAAVGWFGTSPVKAENARTYATDFPLEENPVSEGGVWQHRGASWATVRTFAHRAVGSQTGSGGYDDSYAHLTGFGPNQTAQATVWKDPAIGNDSITCKALRRLGRPGGHDCAGPGTHEVELLLHWADSPTIARGYECNLSWDGKYADIVRWNGPLGDFTYITQQRAFNDGIMPPNSGDIFKATISGSTIRVYLNKNDGRGDQLIATGTDPTYADGDPGMGFYIEGSVDPAQFGFASFRASSD
ncbi:hypothetical protein [Bradyrhizobium sp.]|jgi:hypothetical protein|uniref:hypothetical protein n=1 Tax=Bradyrhizobium sp. TaxID=376 RepID=UPI002C499C9A|nr:hypothetical protein [Bradyrhizobium sp.]HWX59955.1 hypothetical protein [Bradyrhizobium sp.]